MVKTIEMRWNIISEKKQGNHYAEPVILTFEYKMSYLKFIIYKTNGKFNVSEWLSKPMTMSYNVIV